MANFLIVGGSSGIGKRLGEQLVETNNRVYATYYKNKITSDNDLIEFHYLNVLEDIINLEYLPESINGLIYCPGSINLKPFNRITPTDFANDFNFQVIGAIKIIQAVLPRLRNTDNSSIVLFSTVAVQTGFPFHAQVSTSKGAIEGLTKALAAEFSPKIRVNCIAPSITDTPLASTLLNTDQKKEANALRHPLKRIGSTEDIASAVEFLLSTKSGWMTGQVIHLDGGISTLKV